MKKCMTSMFSVIFLCMINVFLCVSGDSMHYYHTGLENAEEFSNEWIVRVQGGEQVAQLLALETGYTYIEKLPEFPDTYIFIKVDHVIQRRAQHELTKALFKHPKVEWAEQLFIKKRQKRDFIIPKDEEYFSRNSKQKSILLATKLNINNRTSKISKREDINALKQDAFMFNDELWSQEWYLHDSRTRDDLPKLDLNVIPVYQMGITGKGVRVSILDDGIEYLHDDLKDNYDPAISYDCNEKDDDPAPKYDSTHRNAHGTRCAGEVAMTANNGKCGVGIAYGSSIGGIKLLDGIVNDRVEGAALGFAYDKIDIYSASWGPNDDGKTVEGPGRLALEVLERGITKGRNGKGTIYVFASGNGGSRGDNCNCDGYIGSIYTVAIGSASQKGAFPWYGEPCAATMAVTYSSGAYQDQMITTTDLNNGCTIKHTGTSASAPLAAGIIALGLEANSNLTWRDVQHLISWTSEYQPLGDNRGWLLNGAGFRFDVRFGFGLMNAHSLVIAAKNWTTVPTKSICEIKALRNINVSVSYNTLYLSSFESDGCIGSDNEVNYLEQVELKVNVLYSIRGVLEMFLTSPKGTRLPVLSQRRLDRSTKGFINWKFMSVGTWGEDPKGTWIIEIQDRVGPLGNNGKVGPLTLILHGTKDRPYHYKNGPRKYNTNYQLFQSESAENINEENGEKIEDKLNNPLYSYENKPLNNKEDKQILNNYFETLLKGDTDQQMNSDSFESKENANQLLNLLENFHPSVDSYTNDVDQFSEEVFDEDRVLNRVHHQNARLNKYPMKSFNYYFGK